MVICNSNYKDRDIRGESKVYSLQISTPSNDSVLISPQCLKRSDAKFISNSYADFSIFELGEITICLFFVVFFSHKLHKHADRLVSLTQILCNCAVT